MLQLKIVSPEKIEFCGAVESVLVPGTMGQFEILQDHAPIISTLQCGTVEYTTVEGKAQLERWFRGGAEECGKSLCRTEVILS